jgi:hypothetical protein
MRGERCLHLVTPERNPRADLVDHVEHFDGTSMDGNDKLKGRQLLVLAVECRERQAHTVRVDCEVEDLMVLVAEGRNDRSHGCIVEECVVVDRGLPFADRDHTAVRFGSDDGTEGRKGHVDCTVVLDGKGGENISVGEELMEEREDAHPRVLHLKKARLPCRLEQSELTVVRHPRPQYPALVTVPGSLPRLAIAVELPFLGGALHVDLILVLTGVAEVVNLRLAGAETGSEEVELEAMALLAVAPGPSFVQHEVRQ